MGVPLLYPVAYFVVVENKKFTPTVISNSERSGNIWCRGRQYLTADLETVEVGARDQ